MQVSLTLTFGPGEDALFEAAVSKIATLGAVLKQAAMSALPERKPATVDLAKHAEVLPPAAAAASVEVPVEDPFAPAEPAVSQEQATGATTAKPKRASLKTTRPTTQDVLGPAPATQPAVEDVFTAGAAPSTADEVSVEQLQKLSTEIITKQPNDRQEVMDCVYSFKTDKGVRAVSWKDLSAPQRVEAMKKLREIYLGDSIPF
jgi:hypothetical protein